MKRILFLLTVIFSLTLSCSHEPVQKKQAFQNSWEELSKDMSQVYALVNSMNNKMTYERSLQAIRIESWEFPYDEYVSISEPSRIFNYPVIKFSEIMIPSDSGDVSAIIIKARGNNRDLWFVIEGGYAFPELVKGHGHYTEIPWKGDTIHLYINDSIHEKIKEIAPVEQFIFFDHYVDEAFEKVHRALRHIQSKYKGSEIYIDGFRIHVGKDLSLDIIYKLRS